MKACCGNRRRTEERALHLLWTRPPQNSCASSALFRNTAPLRQLQILAAARPPLSLHLHREHLPLRSNACLPSVHERSPLRQTIHVSLTLGLRGSIMTAACCTLQDKLDWCYFASPLLLAFYQKGRNLSF